MSRPTKHVQKRTQNTRAKIIKAALQCLSRQGVVESTITRIAKIAKVHHTVVLYHFPTLESLYLEVIQVLLESLRSATLQAVEPHAKAPRKALEAYILAPFEWAQKNREYFSLWMFFYFLASHPGSVFRENNNQIRKQGRERIATFLYQGIASKSFKSLSVANVSELSFQIQSIITGITIQAGTESDPDFTEAALVAKSVIFKLL